MGGKSRKSGGVSRKLIESLKLGNYQPPAKKPKKKGPTTDEPEDRGGFGLLSSPSEEPQR